jgi:hypothetical protein
MVLSFQWLSKLAGGWFIAAALIVWFNTNRIADAQQPSALPELAVKRCQDFSVTGRGEADAWNSVEWVALHRRPGASHDYTARFKLLYSDSGMYVLFDGSDQKLTATLEADFLDLWHEDVFECFFWPDEKHSIYFEYEISPLGYELPILVPNFDGRFLGWRPWHYDGGRKTQRQVSAEGGKNLPMARVTRWRAEVFIPFDLLKPLNNVPPTPGTRWRANFYRVDYDDEQVTQWDWSRVGSSFHEFAKFGTLVFE